MGNFKKEVKSEWKKITWLSKPDVCKRAVITIIGVACVALLSTGIDAAAQALLGLFL